MKKKKRKQEVNPNRKAKITVTLPVKLLDRMRNAVYWTPSLTIAGLAETALESKLKKLEKKRKFRPRRGKIRVGRPPKL
jgi:post-segregation antitoxin (ccd killing protein)